MTAADCGLGFVASRSYGADGRLAGLADAEEAGLVDHPEPGAVGLSARHLDGDVAVAQAGGGDRRRQFRRRGSH